MKLAVGVVVGVCTKSFSLAGWKPALWAQVAAVHIWRWADSCPIFFEFWQAQHAGSREVGQLAGARRWRI